MCDTWIKKKVNSIVACVCVVAKQLITLEVAKPKERTFCLFYFQAAAVCAKTLDWIIPLNFSLYILEKNLDILI